MLYFSIIRTQLEMCWWGPVVSGWKLLNYTEVWRVDLPMKGLKVERWRVEWLAGALKSVFAFVLLSCLSICLNWPTMQFMQINWHRYRFFCIERMEKKNSQFISVEEKKKNLLVKPVNFCTHSIAALGRSVRTFLRQAGKEVPLRVVFVSNRNLIKKFLVSGLCVPAARINN